MDKDFDQWNEKKKKLHDVKSVPYFGEREVWFTSLGSNVGYEQDGQGVDYMHPVIVIKKFNKEICWVIPLSKTERRGEFYFECPFIEGTKSVAILSQLRLVDSRRFGRRVGILDKTQFKELLKKLKDLFP